MEKRPLKAIFSIIDKDKTGFVKSSDISQAYEEFCGKSLTKNELSVLFQCIDVSGDG